MGVFIQIIQFAVGNNRFKTQSGGGFFSDNDI